MVLNMVLNFALIFWLWVQIIGLLNKWWIGIKVLNAYYHNMHVRIKRRAFFVHWDEVVGGGVLCYSLGYGIGSSDRTWLKFLTQVMYLSYNWPCLHPNCKDDVSGHIDELNQCCIWTIIFWCRRRLRFFWAGLSFRSRFTSIAIS